MNKCTRKLEVCVDSFAGLMAARKGGADRIELCSSLTEGGLTPSAGLMQAAAQIGIPCHVMIRPRNGDFNYDRHDIEIMAHDISNVHLYNLNGVVFGIEDGSGNLDTTALGYLMDEAKGLNTTLHRVVDVIADRMRAVDVAVKLGFDRILTSGGAQNADFGTAEIAKMVQHAGEAIIIMPGGGITPRNVAQISRATGTNEFHASCSLAKSEPLSNIFTERPLLYTSAYVVRKMKAALRELEGFSD
mgnify:FL=1